MSDNDDFYRSWLSGTVKRFHVMDTIEPNLTSSHAWGVVLLLLMIWPSAPRELIIAALLHDFGEKATGDMPGPVKWGNPVLEAELDRMELQHTRENLPRQIATLLETVSQSQWAVVELCDRAEFCFRMVHERMLGNRYAEIYYKRAWDKMTRVLEQNRPAFLELSGELAAGIIDMRRGLDDSWREARDGNQD